MSTRLESSPPKAQERTGMDTADRLLLSSYDWESDRERITLGDAIQRFASA